VLLPLPPSPVAPRRNVGFGKVPSGRQSTHSDFPCSLCPGPLPSRCPKNFFCGGTAPYALAFAPFFSRPRRDVGFGKVPSGIHFIHSQPFPLPLPPVPRPLPPCCPKKLQISGAAHATISHSSLMLLRVVLGITVL